jgi:hypothetical protein
LASRFTLAEQSVVSVIAAEHARHGCCALTNGHLAALAVGRTTVKRALRAAQGLGLAAVASWVSLSKFRDGQPATRR